MIIKDAMVLINLAKISVLEKSCNYFKRVLISELVYSEMLKGKEKGFPDVPIILELIKNNKVKIKKIRDKNLIRKANQFNIQGGEAETIALYWQENADLIATDDDNVRKKSALLSIRVIGTLTIILGLYKKKIIREDKLRHCVSELRKIGWFSNVVLDKILMEVENE